MTNLLKCQPCDASRQGPRHCVSRRSCARAAGQVRLPRALNVGVDALEPGGSARLGAAIAGRPEQPARQTSAMPAVLASLTDTGHR